MKLTKSKLKQLIKEELCIILKEDSEAPISSPLPAQSKGQWIPVKEVVRTLKDLEKMGWVLDGEVESISPANDPYGIPNEFLLPIETAQRSASEVAPEYDLRYELRGFIQTVEEHVIENKFNVANLTKFRGPPLDDETRLQAGKIFGRSDDNGPTQFILAFGKR